MELLIVPNQPTEAGRVMNLSTYALPAPIYKNAGTICHQVGKGKWQCYQQLSYARDSLNDYEAASLFDLDTRIDVKDPNILH